MRRYLIIHCIKSLKDIFVAQKTHFAEKSDMTVMNRWNAYTAGIEPFFRIEKHLKSCFAQIQDYQLFLEHKDHSYCVVSGDYDDVVSADTNNWPGVADTKDSGDDPDNSSDDDDDEDDYHPTNSNSDCDDDDDDDDEADSDK